MTVSNVIYAAASVVCHQRPERSFHLGEMPLPVCARCTGLYVGAAAALALAASSARLGGVMASTARARLLVAVSAAPTLMTLAFEWTTGQAPSNSLRAAAGLSLGAGIAWAIAALDVPDVPGHESSVEVN